MYTCEILVVGSPLSCILTYSNKISMKFLEEAEESTDPSGYVRVFLFSLELDDVLMYFLKLTNE